MRSLPLNLETALSQEMNVVPILFILIEWGDGDVVYSTQDVTCDLGTVYPYVKQFVGFDSITRIDGFGSSTTTTVEFFDQVGHFKERFDTINIYSEDLKCKIYLGAKGVEETSLLFEGIIGSDIIYDPDEHIFSVVIESIDRNEYLCYTPSIDDVDSNDTNYERFDLLFTGQTWPHIFGSVKKMELKPLVDDLEFEVDEDLIAGAGPYTMKVAGDLLETIPNGAYTFNVIGSDTNPYNLLITGTLGGVDPNRTISFTNADVTIKWFASQFPMSCTTLDGRDPDGKARKLLLRMDGVSEPPWLKGMFVRVKSTFTFGVSQVVFNFDLRVIDQVKEIPSNPYEKVLVIPAGWYFPIQEITYATMSPSTPHTIKKGAKVIIHNWSKRGIYILDNKYYSDPTEFTNFQNALTLYYDDGYVKQPFPPYVYTVYTTNGNDANKLWTGAIEPHPGCTYVQFDPEVFGRMIVNEKALKKGEGRDYLSTDLTGDITNIYNTDYLAIQKLLTDYTTLGIVTDPNPKPVNFALTDEEDLTTIIPEVAWQKRKALRETVENDVSKIELIDLSATQTSVFSFDSNNIHSDPIILSWTPKEEISTIFKATLQKNDLSEDLLTGLKKKNHDIFGVTETYEMDYYAYSTVSDARADLNFWVNRLSNAYLEAEFTGYFDAISLEVWDVIDIDFGTMEFYDPSRGLPYTNSIAQYGNNIVVSGQAIIREMNIDFNTGLIKFKVQFLDKTIGGI